MEKTREEKEKRKVLECLFRKNSVQDLGLGGKRDLDQGQAKNIKVSITKIIRKKREEAAVGKHCHHHRSNDRHQKSRYDERGKDRDKNKDKDQDRDAKETISTLIKKDVPLEIPMPEEVPMPSMPGERRKR